KMRLKGRIEKYQKILHSSVWLGMLETKKHHASNRILRLEENAELKKIELDLAEVKTPSHMKALIEAFNLGFIFSGPVYIGVTEHQTIRVRYLQHKSAYLGSDTGSSFGNRVREAGIEWSDLAFGYIEMKEL